MKKRLSKEQRLQMKGTICILTLLLLFILLLTEIGRRVVKPKNINTDQTISHSVTELYNVYVIDNDENEVVIYHDGMRERYPFRANLFGVNEAYEIREEKSEQEEKTKQEEQVKQEEQQEQGKRKKQESKKEQVTFAVEERYKIKEQICDVVITDGYVSDIIPKTEKIRDKVERVWDDRIEFENLGTFELSEKYRGYRVFSSLQMMQADDLVIGYDFADFVLEEGKICGILFTREEPMQEIRVLLKTKDFAGYYHHEFTVHSDTRLLLSYKSGDRTITDRIPAGNKLRLDRNSTFFEQDGDYIQLKPETSTGLLYPEGLERACGDAPYRGSLEIRRMREGLVVVNILPLEEYLYSVVPSEMPSSWPDEALKAQAVCARTYAYDKMHSAGYPELGAHVDDSTSFQVYHNLGEQESTTNAVKETYGEIFYAFDGSIAKTYYYSTSCGRGTNEDAWNIPGIIDRENAKEKQNDEQSPETRKKRDCLYITRNEDHIDQDPEDPTFLLADDPQDYEYEQPWYRWTYAPSKLDCNRLAERVSAYLGWPVSFQTIKNINVTLRGMGGVATSLLISTDSGDYVIRGENGIRQVLCDGETAAIGKDGTQLVCNNLVPSAFFILKTSLEEENVVGYTLTGGGLGHGIGMSQSAAKCMANEGYNYSDILAFFYHGMILKSIYITGGSNGSRSSTDFDTPTNIREADGKTEYQCIFRKHGIFLFPVIGSHADDAVCRDTLHSADGGQRFARDERIDTGKDVSVGTGTFGGCL